MVVDAVPDVEISLRLFACPHVLEPSHIVAIKKWGIPAKDCKELAHVSDGEELPKSLFLKEVQRGGMHQFLQFTA